jgi:hypothetical protein
MPDNTTVGEVLREFERKYVKEEYCGPENPPMFNLSGDGEEAVAFLCDKLTSLESTIREEYGISDEDLQRMEDQKEEVWDAVNRGESVYLSKRGSLITEERYCDFEDMAGSVGLPAGSEVERFVEIKKVRPARKGNQ